MKEEGSFFLFVLCFLKQHIRNLFLYLLFCIIFAVILFLYALPVEAVGYAALLCVFLGSFFLLYDLLQGFKRHKELKELKNIITVDIERLPDAKTIVEQDYQGLVTELYRNKRELESNYATMRKDMLDYYTLWAHQVKTPITAMSLVLQSEDSSQNGQLRQELFKIEQYVEMVLQYLRMESMSSDLLLAEYDLEKIVRRAVKKYASVFIYNHISLILEPLNETALTDEKWLCFVIEQLLSNALKYTKYGEIRIYMDKGEKKSLVIEDTGIGICEEDLPRVFEHGFTGYNGRMNKKSSGLGLYLCQKILNHLSHKIWIESQVGEGTKVFLDLSANELEVE